MAKKQSKSMWLLAILCIIAFLLGMYLEITDYPSLSDTNEFENLPIEMVDMYSNSADPRTDGQEMIRVKLSAIITVGNQSRDVIFILTNHPQLNQILKVGYHNQLKYSFKTVRIGFAPEIDKLVLAGPILINLN